MDVITHKIKAKRKYMYTRIYTVLIKIRGAHGAGPTQSRTDSFWFHIMGKTTIRPEWYWTYGAAMCREWRARMVLVTGNGGLG